MNRDDVIRMTQVIAAQYSKAERCQTWTHDYMMQRLMELVDASASVEREACEQVCYELRHENRAAETDDWIFGTYACANAIRSRSDN